jgi:hypothetical protein
MRNFWVVPKFPVSSHEASSDNKAERKQVRLQTVLTILPVVLIWLDGYSSFALDRDWYANILMRG